MKTVSTDFEARELAATRQPAELFRIWKDGGAAWYLTNGDAEIVYNGHTYTPAVIERGKVQYNSALEVSEVKITTTHLADIAQLHLAVNPVDIYWLEILRVHRDMDPIEASVIFVGQIKNVSFKGPEAVANGVGFEYFLKVSVIRFRYQITCNHNVFDARCTLDQESYKAVGTVASVSADGLTVVVSAFGSVTSGYLSLGWAESGGYKTMIAHHEGSTLTLRIPIPDLEAGDSITAYWGCDGKAETCRDKYANILNFLGFIYIPTSNPVTWM